MTQKKGRDDRARERRAQRETQSYLGGRLRRELEVDQDASIPDDFMALLKRADRAANDQNKS